MTIFLSHRIRDLFVPEIWHLSKPFCGVTGIWAFLLTICMGFPIVKLGVFEGREYE